MKKHLLMKTLLVALVCLVGGTSSVWADPIETVGSTSSGWWTDFSSTYTLEGYGKYHFQFTTTNVNDGTVYKTWLLVATDGNDSHGGDGNEYFVWRGEGYAWGQGKNSNAYNATTNTAGDPTNLVCSNTYATANPTGAGIQAAMNGAAVDMVITRESNNNNIYATATVTPTNGENEFTMSFSYLYGNATSANVGLFFTVQNAQVVLNTAEQTSKWTTVWTTDFSSAPTGMTYSVTNGNCAINAGGYLYYNNDGAGAARAINTAFTSDAFNVDTDWIMEFDWNCHASNTTGNTSNVAFATNQGTAFTITWNGNSSDPATITDASSTSLTTTLPTLGTSNRGTFSSSSHFIITGIDGDGVYLTVTKGGTTYVNNQKVSSSYGYPVSFNGSLGRAYAWMYLDNISFKTPAVAGFVATPTSEITGAAGTSRKFTLSCLTDGATIYYATTDLEKGAAGWETYTGEVTTAATTIYAYAKKGSDTSDKMNFATGAGTTLKLNTPVISKTAYADGNYTISISSDQSSLAIVPSSPSVKYSIDGGSAQTYSAPFSVASGKTITTWVENTGYTSSDEASATTTARPTGYSISWEQDYRNVTSAAGTGAQAIGLSDVVFTVDGVDFKNIISYGASSEAVSLNTNVGLNTSTGVNLRTNGVNSGILVNNTTEAKIGIQNLKVGDYVVLSVMNVVPTASYGVTLQEGMSLTSEYYFLATETSASINIPKGTYNYVYSIKVLSLSTVSVTVTDADFATYVPSYDLNFSATEIEAYKVKVTAKGVATLTKVNNVPAGTPVLLYKDGGKTENIPVMTGAAAVSDNDLVAGTGAAVATIDGDYTNMILNNVSGIGFYFAAGQTVATNRAYLHFATTLAPDPASTARMTMIFEDEDVTGVNEVRSQKEDVRSEWFDLQGRKVAQPAKGLYIVNGRKVVVK